MLPSTAREMLRFGDFDLDVEAYQLRRRGRPIRLERRPMELLILLVERRGRLVSRSDIADQLWGKDVFVDVETGVNIAIRKVRQTLRDSAEKPAFVETVVGKGYRFVAAVEVVSDAAEAGLARTRDELPETTKAQTAVRRSLVPGLFACAVLAALLVWAWLAVHPTPVKLAVL